MEKLTNKELKEKTIHGSEKLPISIYQENFERRKFPIYYHWHDEIEIIRISSGNALFLASNKKWKVGPGDILIIPSRQIHALLDVDDVVDYISLVLDLKMLKSRSSYDTVTIKYIDPLINVGISETVSIKADVINHDVYTSIDNLTRVYFEKPIGYELLIKGNLFHFLFYLFNCNILSYDCSILEEEWVISIQKAIEYIQENYHERIDIDDVSQYIGYSRFHFMKIFKIYTGSTFNNYLKNIRLDKSEKLLVTTNKSIHEIAIEVGYPSSSLFIKHFKEAKNVSPLQFKKTESSI